MRISIPENINDRVSIGTRNKSNGACSSPAMILCILHPPSPFLLPTYACTIDAQCRDPIPFILLPFSTVYFRQQHRTALSIDANLYTYKTQGYIRGLLRNRIFAVRGRKISEYLRLNSTKYRRIFRRSLWIFRSCYWHTLRDGIYLQLC